MTKVFNKLKKPCFGPFWSIFPILGAKKHSRKSGSVMHNFIWISSTMPKFRKKLMMQFQENTWTEEQPEGRKDGQTLFHRTLPATIGGIINCMEFCCHCFELYYGDQKTLKKKKIDVNRCNRKKLDVNSA